ncbi:unnamed protein product [Durusdinium trenchii]|uniref:Phosphodiesterase n=1 Tax=Durusdinium trenchii TaxID=1381693 RepID=A0ABP0MN47_9DINO
MNSSQQDADTCDTPRREEREGLLSAASQAERADSTSGSSPGDGIRGSLEALRRSMQQVLDSWWTSRACRREMEESLRRLRAIEVDLAQLQRPRRPSLEHEKSSLEELREEIQIGKTKSVSLSRRWLVETFTEANHEAPTSRRSSVSEVMSPRISARAAEEESSVAKEPTLKHLEEEAADLLERAGMLDFNTVACGEVPGMKGHLLQVLFKTAVKQDALLEKLDQQGNLVSEVDFNQSLFTFLGRIEEMYCPQIPYHTALHAADVMMTTEWFLRAPTLASEVSELDHVMVLIACAIHDVGHNGRNNLFHTKTMSPLAITYNDKSVLENMHVASAFEVMQQDAQYNWLAHLQQNFLPESASKAVNLQQYIRRGIIDIVLGTDMAKHIQHQKFLASRVAAVQNQNNAEANGETSKMEFLEAIMHAADISNPCKPRKMMLHWTQRVIEEFWAQGDEEMRLNIEVSPMCDRITGEDSIPKQQLGFIDFVITPYYTPLAELIPEVKEATKNMLDNRSFWLEKESQQAHCSHLFKENAEG